MFIWLIAAVSQIGISLPKTNIRTCLRLKTRRPLAAPVIAVAGRTANTIFFGPKYRITQTIGERSWYLFVSRGERITFLTVIASGDQRTMYITSQRIARRIVSRLTESQGVGCVAAQCPTVRRMALPQAGVGRAQIALDNISTIGIARIVHAVLQS